MCLYNYTDYFLLEVELGVLELELKQKLRLDKH